VSVLLSPSWQLSFGLAATSLVGWVACLALGRRLDVRGLNVATGFTREAFVIMGLLGTWQWVGQYVHTHVAGAMDRGRQIARLQADWHLPSEQSVQHLVSRVPWLVNAADVYYAYAHLNGMALFVLWLWWRHRPVYPRARFVIIASTFACLLVQSIPVAPPRLLPQLGFVDTALRDGRSVYGPFGDGLANQLAAMPSVHVGWAVIVAWYVWWAAPRRWRWIGPLHAVVTVLVVVATANHWWLDGAVAAGFDALAMLAGWAVARWWATRRGTTSAVAVPSRQGASASALGDL
jgi:hypothetical protein